MNQERSRWVPARLSRAALLLPLLVAGCIGVPDTNAGDPMVVTEDGTTMLAPASGARADAIADMRAQAAAAEARPYPDVFQGEQRPRLAARPEPRAVPDVQEIEAELAAIARRRAGGVSRAELAGLARREAELRRLAAAAQALQLRP
jgi:hypothetical protein